MSSSSKAANPEKGARYLALLDQALCNGNWSEVPELARKTEKHAPNRKCLTLAARSEAQLSSASHRPASASSTATSSIHGLSELVPRLTEAISIGNSIEEDAYVASVCLAQIHWLREDHQAALEVLPDHVPKPNNHSSLPSALGWLEVCNVKATYIRVSALTASDQDADVEKYYQHAVAQTPGTRTPELRRWTERLLAKSCTYYSDRASTPTTTSLSQALRAFQAWNDLWRRATPPSFGSGNGLSMIDIPRRKVWKANYDLLSTILQYGLIYNPAAQTSAELLAVPTADIGDSQYIAAKQRQRAELKGVETKYESLLLNETQFPKASQSNNEVEEWVAQAAGNWKILCGSTWSDADLGEGGKERVGRNLLDILYRAATKTYHSTAILRHLFNVHASLGDFDLAINAFNSYAEIADRAKARAEKTGQHELGFDDDDIAVITAAEAVKVLCRYGDRDQAEKAIEVGKQIQRWLAQQRPTSIGEVEGSTSDNRAEQANPPSRPTEFQLRPTTIASAYRAIGQSQAQWARFSYGDYSWSSLQQDAIRNFRRAEAQDPGSIDTAYALALLQAEMRDVTGAIATLKQILVTRSGDDATGDDSSRQRKLLPCWHLLALCLTARDQPESALKMYDAALDQFGGSTALFGQTLPHTSQDPEKQASSTRLSRGIVDQIEGLEKESIIQLKTSQMAIVELMEGPNAAVDISGELLGLYARLFGSPEPPKSEKPPNTAVSTAPSRKPGTLRSIAGSIRPRSPRASIETGARGQGSNTLAPGSVSSPLNNVEANDQPSGAPLQVTITNEDGAPADGRGRHEHKHFPLRLLNHHHDGRPTSRSRSRSIGGRERLARTKDENPPPLPRKDINPGDYAAKSGGHAIDNPVDSSIKGECNSRPDQPIKSMDHNASPESWPAPAGHGDQPPKQDLRLPAPHPASSYVPEPRFASAQQRRLKTSVLVHVWLFIAGLYMRAEMHDDAAGAIDEASKLVQSFEADISAEHSSARELYKKGWGGGKSVDELWADVYCVKGDAASIRAQPFEAMEHFERALAYFPDHAEAIICLSDLLMDIYEQKLPAEAPKGPSSTPASTAFTPSAATSPSMGPTKQPANLGPQIYVRGDPTPAELNRLAARDRAYMLLSHLTRLGTGWDNAEAWYTLARSYELSGQIDKAKKALWWVVELEEAKPVRDWRVAAGGAGFTV